METSRQVVRFVAEHFTSETYVPPSSPLILPSNSGPMRVRVEEPSNCFVAAGYCCLFDGAFVCAATAAVLVPQEFNTLEIVEILDESSARAGKDNPLAPSNSVSRSLHKE